MSQQLNFWTIYKSVNPSMFYGENKTYGERCRIPQRFCEKRTEKRDCECIRNGTANIFVAVGFKAGKGVTQEAVQQPKIGKKRREVGF